MGDIFIQVARAPSRGTDSLQSGKPSVSKVNGRLWEVRGTTTGLIAFCSILVWGRFIAVPLRLNSNIIVLQDTARIILRQGVSCCW